MFYSWFFATGYAVVFLTAIACYCLGLHIGWQTRKVSLIFGSLILPALVIALVAIKGFAVDTIAVLLLFVLALVVSVTLKFRSTPL